MSDRKHHPRCATQDPMEPENTCDCYARSELATGQREERLKKPMTKKDKQDSQPTSDPTVADAKRFQWLIKQGLAWRDCYDRDWLPGEWLYAVQDARHFVDKAMARTSNSVDNAK